MKMKLMSLNVGQPRVVETARGSLLTSIFKEPVAERRKVIPHNVEGDRQADLTVHGGPKKAVYAYAQEHYAYWAETLPDHSLPCGAFGENLTVSGLLENKIHIGDLLEVGTAKLRVTQPRMPCVKLAVRFHRPDMVKLFWQSNRSGIYFAVEEAGETGAGDDVRLLEENPLHVSVADVVSLYKGESTDADLYQRFLAAPLAGGWKEGIQERWTAQ
jgi:MOSC domain-containing protein YiiM